MKINTRFLISKSNYIEIPINNSSFIPNGLYISQLFSKLFFQIRVCFWSCYQLSYNRTKTLSLCINLIISSLCKSLKPNLTLYVRKMSPSLSITSKSFYFQPDAPTNKRLRRYHYNVLLRLRLHLREWSNRLD
jgi:hypothetical protein